MKDTLNKPNRFGAAAAMLKSLASKNNAFYRYTDKKAHHSNPAGTKLLKRIEKGTCTLKWGK